MDKTIAAIRLLDAIAGGIRQAPGPEGDDHIVAVSADSMLILDAVRTIATALNWRVETVDAVRTNFRDMEVEASPLRKMVRHASESDLQYVIIVQSACPELLEHQIYRNLIERMALDIPVVLCMDEPPQGAHGWTVVDLREAH